MNDEDDKHLSSLLPEKKKDIGSLFRYFKRNQ
jgi:hypothetical protein